MIQGYLKGEVGEGEMSAFLMAVFLRGMNREETYHLTLAMAHSGEVLDLSQIEGVKVDKHSTGGVGDKVTLVFAPLVASGGLIVSKLSGRALGHTGGTVDKLEAIPGFRVSLSREEFISQLKKVGIAVSSQTQELAPADKLIYSLRDRIACVESIPLIASSIMSKKIAGGADVIVIDVKSGKGAFMSGQRAKELAEELVAVGEMAGKKVAAEITPMDQPLGYAVGRILEVKEAINLLRGEGPEDLEKVSISLAGLAFWKAGVSDSKEEGKGRAKALLASGKALEKFAQWMEAQGANPHIVEDFSLLPTAECKAFITDKEGILLDIDCRRLGEISHILDVHPAGGVVLRKKLGERVNKGEELALLYGEPSCLEEALESLKSVFSLN